MRVLIVEDEVLVGVELGFIVEEMGHQPVGHAISSSEALAMARELRPDLALVDVHLTDGPTGVEVARKIAEDCGAMVLFMTANQKRVPEDFAGAAGVIAKPYSNRGVCDAIDFVVRCMRQGAAGAPAPHSLTVAPDYARRWRMGDEAAAGG